MADAPAHLDGTPCVVIAGDISGLDLLHVVGLDHGPCYKARIAELETERDRWRRVAERVEGEKQRLAEALGMSTPFPAHDVLVLLADAETHLRHDHNCDCHGHERRLYASEAARRLAEDIRAALASELTKERR